MSKYTHVCVVGSHTGEYANLLPTSKAELLLSSMSLQELMPAIVQSHLEDEPGMIIQWQGGTVGWIPEELVDKYFQALNDEGMPVNPTKSTFVDFGTALRALKSGSKARRAAWTDQHLELATDIRYVDTKGGLEETSPIMHASKGLVIINDIGSPIGWFSSMTDILAEDWIVEN